MFNANSLLTFSGNIAFSKMARRFRIGIGIVGQMVTAGKGALNIGSSKVSIYVLVGFSL